MHKPRFLSYKHPQLKVVLDFHAVVSSRFVLAGVSWKGNAGLSFWVLPLGFLLFVCLFVLSLSSIILCPKGMWEGLGQSYLNAKGLTFILQCFVP